MRKFALVAVAALTLMTVGLKAQGADVSGTDPATGVPQAGTAASSQSNDADGWRYCWHNSRWWYWMPENKWVVWTGSKWIPYGEFCNPGGAIAGSSAIPYSVGYGSYEQPSQGFSSPVYSNTRSWGNTGVNSGSGYAGYGWTWGPGTVYSSAPGRRF
jgi:hypothetical protein